MRLISFLGVIVIDPVNFYLHHGFRQNVQDRNLEKMFQVSFVAFAALKIAYDYVQLHQKLLNMTSSVLDNHDYCITFCLRSGLVVSGLFYLLLRNMRGPDYRVQRRHSLDEALRICLNRGLDILNLEPRWRYCIQVAKAACYQDAHSFKYFDQSVRGHLDVFLAALASSQKDPKILSYIREPLKSAKYLIKLALQKGANLEYALDEFKDDGDLVLEAVSIDGMQLAFASDRLRAFYGIVRKAVLQNPKSIKYAHEDLKNLLFVFDCYSRRLDRLDVIVEEDMKKELALKLVIYNFSHKHKAC